MVVDRGISAAGRELGHVSGTAASAVEQPGKGQPGVSLAFVFGIGLGAFVGRQQGWIKRLATPLHVCGVSSAFLGLMGTVRGVAGLFGAHRSQGVAIAGACLGLAGGRLLLGVLAAVGRAGSGGGRGQDQPVLLGRKQRQSMKGRPRTIVDRAVWPAAPKAFWWPSRTWIGKWVSYGDWVPPDMLIHAGMAGPS
jgi:hypothetical protein